MRDGRGRGKNGRGTVIVRAVHANGRVDTTRHRSGYAAVVAASALALRPRSGSNPALQYRHVTVTWPSGRVTTLWAPRRATERRAYAARLVAMRRVARGEACGRIVAAALAAAREHVRRVDVVPHRDRATRDVTKRVAALTDTELRLELARMDAELTAAESARAAREVAR